MVPNKASQHLSTERCGLLCHWLGRVLVPLMGWRIVGTVSAEPRVILIAAHHTSNWDFVIGLPATWALGLKIRWLGKQALFRGLGGPFFRFLGGIAIDRSETTGLVEDLTRAVRSREQICLALAPEGTRSAATHWKSGFYRVAVATQVPVMIAYLDYGTRTAGIGGTLTMTGRVRDDMDRIRAVFTDVRGRRQENETPIRLREED